MSECVQVIVRCRPLNDRELETNTDIVMSADPVQRQCVLRKPGDKVSNPRKVFTFDGVYDTDSTNEEIYTDIVSPLVESVLEGYNGCVFAYGQTSCGKTFSMQGIDKPPSQRGIMNRAIDQIFENIQITDVTYYLIRASYLEIYNEEIRDLLIKNNRGKLDIKEHPEKGVYVRGLSSVEVTTVEEMEEVLEVGGWNRALGATALNPDSSRSHCIFIIDFELCFTSEKDEKEQFRSGRLNLVDLAGSERQMKTKLGEERFKEATKINLSLSALGNVISALVNEKSKHIPYRASKLTRLLQDSLGGNSRTLMIACVSPGENNYSETLSTLRYANRAKNIKNRPRINEDPKDALIRQYQKEIKMLRQILANQMKISNVHDMPVIPLPTSTNDINDSTHQKPPFRSAVVISKQARLEYEQKISELQHRYDYEHVNKEKLQGVLTNLKTEFDNFRLRSEYTLQRLQAENKLKVDALRSQMQSDKSEGSSSDDFPCSSTSVEFSCSSCEDLADWSEKSFDGRPVLRSESRDDDSSDNSHLWSYHWLKCYCGSPKKSLFKSKKIREENIDNSNTSQENEKQVTCSNCDGSLKVERGADFQNVSADKEDGAESPRGDREEGDGNSDVSAELPESTKDKEVITDQPGCLENGKMDNKPDTKPEEKAKVNMLFRFYVMD